MFQPAETPGKETPTVVAQFGDTIITSYNRQQIFEVVVIVYTSEAGKDTIALFVTV